MKKIERKKYRKKDTQSDRIRDKYKQLTWKTNITKYPSAPLSAGQPLSALQGG